MCPAIFWSLRCDVEGFEDEEEEEEDAPYAGDAGDDVLERVEPAISNPSHSSTTIR